LFEAGIEAEFVENGEVTGGAEAGAGVAAGGSEGEGEHRNDE
jgi:hypothetical protein